MSVQQNSPTGILMNKKVVITMGVGASALVNTIVHSGFLKFFTDFVGMKPATFGLVYMIFTIWNAINDPLFGMLMDKVPYHPKRGKYVYIMRVTAPLCILSVLGLLFIQPSWPEWLMFITLLIGLFIFDTANTAFRMTYDAYLLLIAPSREERTEFSMIISYVCMVPSFLGSAVTVAMLTGNYPRGVVMATFTIICLIGAILFFLGTYFLKDSPRLYESGVVEEERPTFERSSRGKHWMKEMWQDAYEIIRGRAFMTYIMFSICAGGVSMMYMNPYGYYMQHVLGVGGIKATLPDVVGGVVQVLMYPFLAYMMRKKRCS